MENVRKRGNIKLYCTLFHHIKRRRLAALQKQRAELKVPVERYWYRCLLHEHELVPDIENDSIIILGKA